MKRLALSALAAALTFGGLTLSSQAAPISGVAKIAATSQTSSLVDHVRWCGCHHYPHYRPLFWRGCHRRWWR